MSPHQKVTVELWGLGGLLKVIEAATCEWEACDRKQPQRLHLALLDGNAMEIYPGECTIVISRSASKKS
jgi:hypothetical protein